MSLQQAQAFINKNIKKAERDWLMLDEFVVDLAAQNEGKVKREQLERFIDKNQFVFTVKTDDSSYQGYTEAGGTNYRNLLFHIPRKNEKSPKYTAGHFREDGAQLAFHIRLKDRLTPDGKKILYIEEIQSDWGSDYNNFIKKKAQQQQILDVLEPDNKTIDNIGQTLAKEILSEQSEISASKTRKLIAVTDYLRTYFMGSYAAVKR